MMWWVHMADRTGPYLWEAAHNADEIMKRVPFGMSHETFYIEAQSGDMLNIDEIVRLEPYTGGLSDE